MLHITLIECLGYLASVLIAASMFMKDMVKLRYVNLIGCLIFSTYGFITKAYPVAYTNGLIAIVDFYFIWKTPNTKSEVSA